MAVIAEWNGHVFQVEPNRIQSFKDLTIQGGLETKKVTTAGIDTVVAKKNSTARKVTLTAILSYAAGVKDVQEEAIQFVQEAVDGAEAYLYCGGQKLIACMLLLTSAKVTQIEMTSTGMWTYADVELTLEQSSKLDGQKAKKTGSGNGTVRQIVEKMTIGFKDGTEAASKTLSGKTTTTGLVEGPKVVKISTQNLSNLK